ncbi:MAG: hypothetical protein NVS1B11_02350 [Terriglobales bacterium]
MQNAAVPSRKFEAAKLSALIVVFLFITHLPLLRLPYFWDEAGYYIPAARDLLLSGTLIPHSTPSNAHPPLFMAYLALWWKLFTYSLVVTRSAMLMVAAFTLLGVFRLARRVANIQIALGSVICTAIYPVFFAQSSLAHLDLAAAGLTLWGLLAYLDQRRTAMVIWFSLAVLAKETAILACVGLFTWEVISFLRAKSNSDSGGATQPESLGILTLLVPAVPLAAWYLYHYLHTGFVFGNPEFFRYNVQGTLHPLRILLALLMRLWQTFGYLNVYVLTLAMGLAMLRPALRDDGIERSRIAFPMQFAFLSVVLAYIIAMAVVGGAVLARYMLPVIPLVIIVSVSTIWRRVRLWWAVLAFVVLAFVGALFFNPPYGFSPEDNLAYRDYIQLHQRAEDFLETRYPASSVLTAWPANDELTRPYLGYVRRPMRVVRVEDFTADSLFSVAGLENDFDVALVFSLKYEPPRSPFDRWRLWQQWKTKFFGYHRDLPPAVAAQILGGHIVYTEKRQRQWIAVIELDRIQEARALRVH